MKYVSYKNELFVAGFLFKGNDSGYEKHGRLSFNSIQLREKNREMTIDGVVFVGVFFIKLLKCQSFTVF